MPERGFEIGSRLQLDAAEALIVEAFASQRRHLLDVARTLDDDEWARPSRCSSWNAHQLLLHVTGATEACRTTLAGEDPVFEGGFDPNSGPNEFVDLHAAEPIAQSLAALESEVDATLAVIDAQRGEHGAPLTVTAVWGDPIDWRLFVTHMFFDGWVHERDLLLPLGRPVAESTDRDRLGTAYTLHLGGIVAGLFGIALDTTLAFDGPGSGTYRLQVDGRDVRVTVDPSVAGRPIAGNAVTVTDSMLGRDPELATVLDAPAHVIDALSGVGTFLRG